ncbi:IQ calmodulin-binding protein, putative [Bodo saltans]|uniref:IQ calmodulin-binding protein, putative n=1 Tax=Bodo saltans TaxID=75058 RepID=A0A0S4JMV8_BODSA|nr:IQ calmodulin-binding protein, putative [Bodo saltans]|eukprot:CUG92836.1 IQ calmodulin-binding protein, putative [Bodo saltans]
MAARCIQRFSRLVRSVRLLQRKRDWDHRAKQLAHLEYAAQKIQRCWQLKVARNTAAMKKIEMEERSQAASFIQNNARVWVAKSKLRRLQQKQEDLKFGEQLERSALRIQANFRGWRVRLWYANVLQQRDDRYNLLHRVAQNYLFRKDLAMYYLRNRRARAANRIQTAYRHYRSLIVADRRFRMRVSMVTGMRQREAAAVAIQRNIRCFFAVNAFKLLRHRRHSAAIRIQTQVRMMLARQVLDALIYDFRRELAARRVQMMWLATVHKFRQRREVFEYEAQLLQMDLTALFRSEANSRRDIHLQEDHLWSRELYRFQTILTKLTEEYAVRLAAWRKRSPAELQQEAATRIQSVLRGHLSRRGGGDGTTLDASDIPRAEEEEDDVTTDMTEDMLNRYDRQRGRDPYLPTQQNGPTSAGQANVHHDSRVAKGTAVAQNLRLLSHGLMPSLLQEAAARQRKAVHHLHNGGSSNHDVHDDASDEPPQSWFAWLAERPELCNRSFERLLQRETSARVRVEQVYEVELALLQAQYRVPENAHLRPILALTTRSHSLISTARDDGGGSSSARKQSTSTPRALAATADGTSSSGRAALTVVPSSSSVATPRSRGIVLPPMLHPNSHAALHSHHVASIVTNTYPPSRAEALRDVMGLSREAVTGTAFRNASLLTSARQQQHQQQQLTINHGAWEDEDIDTAAVQVAVEEHRQLTIQSVDESVEENVAAERSQARTDSAAACDLRSLNLSDTQLSLILEKLRSNTVFTALYLDHNRIHDHTCSDIGGLMLHNTAIATYSLANSDISDVGATHLVSSILKAPHVLVVDLRGTMVTEPYRKHLSNLLNRNIARARQVREQREREELLQKQAQLALHGVPSQQQSTTHRTGFAALRSLPPPQPATTTSAATGTQAVVGNSGVLAPARTGRSAATSIKQNIVSSMSGVVDPEMVL